MKCYILGCSNRTETKNSGVSFHRIPEKQYKSWMKILGRSDTIPFNAKRRICSEHFNINSFILAGTKRVLKIDALPTLKMNQLFKIPSSSLNIPTIVSPTSQSCDSLSEGQDSKLPGTSSSDSNGLIGSLKRRRRDVKIVHNYCVDQDKKLPEPAIKCRIRDARIIQDYSEDQDKLLETSSSESEGLIDSPKRRRRDLRTVHNYCLSPRKMMADLNKLRTEKSLLQKKLKASNERVKRLSTKVTQLKVVVKDLIKNKTMTDESITILVDP